jgi:hypothetical protein
MVSYGVAFMSRNESGAREYVREIEPKGEERFKEQRCDAMKIASTTLARQHSLRVATRGLAFMMTNRLRWAGKELSIKTKFSSTNCGSI